MRIDKVVSTALASAFLAASAQAAEPEERPIGQTLTLRGKVMNPTKEGEARFRITAVTWGQKISLLGTHYVAIIFHGDAAPDRKCPYYQGRENIIQETEKASEYIVTTTASPAEIDHVKKAGCMITERPDLTNIRPRLPQELPDYTLR